MLSGVTRRFIIVLKKASRMCLFEPEIRRGAHDIYWLLHASSGGIDLRNS